MKKVKVLHLLSSRTFNGAENVVCQINNMISDQNIELIYCSLDGPVREHVENNQMKFVAVKDMSCKEVRKVIKNISPDIIHAHDMKASFIASVVNRGIPLISHIHNNNSDSHHFSIKTLLYLYSALKAKHIFWVSNSSYNGYYFNSFIKNKSEILYNVIDIKQLYEKSQIDSEEYAFDIIYLGRLAYPKNPRRMVKILCEIANANAEFKAAVVGEGEDSEDVKEYVNSKGLNDRIKFLGYMKNPYKVLSSSKIMLMTSLWEGTPMCVLEALSFGVPVVSTPVDGLCDLIINNENGYLSDQDDVLVKKCEEILMNKEFLQQMSRNAKETALKLMDLSIYKERILKAYNKALE